MFQNWIRAPFIFFLINTKKGLYGTMMKRTGLLLALVLVSGSAGASAFAPRGGAKTAKVAIANKKVVAKAAAPLSK